MVEFETLSSAIPYTLTQVFFSLILIVYAFRTTGVRLLLLLLLVPLFIGLRSERDERNTCELRATVKACALYTSGVACENLIKSFESDEEWGNYLFAAHKGLPASDARLRYGYGAAFFPECEQELQVISQRIAEPLKEPAPSRNQPLTLTDPLVYIPLGLAGIFSSLLVLLLRTWEMLRA